MSSGIANFNRREKVKAIRDLLKKKIAEKENVTLVGESVNYIKYTASSKDGSVTITFRYKFTERVLRHERLWVYGDNGECKRWSRIKSVSIKKYHEALVKKGLV